MVQRIELSLRRLINMTTIPTSRDPEPVLLDIRVTLFLSLSIWQEKSNTLFTTTLNHPLGTGFSDRLKCLKYLRQVVLGLSGVETHS